MEFSQLIASRYSVRAYTSNPVEDWKLEQVLDAARLAPTAHNNQPFQMIVIHTAGRQSELMRIYRREWFSQAPLLLCACGVARQAWVRSDDQRRYLDVDVAIAMDHLILRATDLGLGTCWIAAFNAKAAREILELPAEVNPLIFTPLGYPADQPGPKSRKPLSELVRYEKW